jgi:hypothetical protein
MSLLFKGFVAGFIATIVLSVMMVVKTMMGIMPELDVIKMTSTMMGQPDNPTVGWMVHFVIGTLVYGGAIALTAGIIAGNVTRGIVIGIAGWLLMMVMIMPMAGAGIFGMNMGIMAPVMTFMLHLIFGVVLGWVYSKLTPSEA